MEAILGHLLRADAAVSPIEGVEVWWRRHTEVARMFGEPVDRALAGGFAADRLGFAFASGYTEALRRLIPELAVARAALCATERAGNRPRHIETRLESDGDGWRLTGEKTFTTLGSHAEQLIVLASAGRDDQDRNHLAAVIVPTDREGVTMVDGAATPFAPEIPHAITRFEAVRVEAAERLPGDGYERYLKPFRTVEDCHVWAAAIGWWIQIARHAGWPGAAVDEMACLAVAARALALADPSSPAVHVAYSGLAEQTRRWLADCEPHWQLVDTATRERWERDRALLRVAHGARVARLDVARRRLAE